MIVAYMMDKFMSEPEPFPSLAPLEDSYDNESSEITAGTIPVKSLPPLHYFSYRQVIASLAPSSEREKVRARFELA